MIWECKEFRVKDILLEYFEGISKPMMTSFESKAAKIIDKFNGKKFNFWKYKIKMLLASMDLWMHKKTHSKSMCKWIMDLDYTMNWGYHQFIILKSVFLNIMLEVEIYIDQLKGFVQEKNLCVGSNKLCMGSSYHRIHSFFSNECFCSNLANHLLYVKQTDEYLLVVSGLNLNPFAW